MYGNIAHEIVIALRLVSGTRDTNPIAVFVTFHRITRPDKLTDRFTGSRGCAAMKLLLEHEAA